MTIAYKSLAQGQLASSEGDLYAVPGATSALVKKILICNIDNSSQTVSVFLQQSGGTSRQYLSIILTQYQSFEWDLDLALSTGDKIRGYSTAASKVNYFITGAEKS